MAMRSETLSVHAKTASSITLKYFFINGTSKCGIEWYYKKSTASKWTAVGGKKISHSTSTKSVLLPIKGLLPNTAYSVKTVVNYENGSKATTKTKSVTTPADPCVLTCTAGPTYIKATVSGIVKRSDIKRVLKWYYRRDPLKGKMKVETEVDGNTTIVTEEDTHYGEAAKYTLFATTELDSSTTGAKKKYTGLSKETDYDIKVVLAKRVVTKTVETSKDSVGRISKVTTTTNHDTSLKTMTKDVKTGLSSDDVPTADIVDIEQLVPTNKVVVRWESPEHILGTVYQICVKQPGGSNYSVLATINELKKVKHFSDRQNFIPENTSNTELQAGPKLQATTDVGSVYGAETEVTINNMYLNAGTYKFKITSTNGRAPGVTRESEEVSVVLRKTFAWDTTKYTGHPFDLTAAEWNRLREWIAGCLQRRDIRYEIGDGPSKYPMTEAVEGQPVDNEMFNQVADAVEAAMATSVYTYDGGWTMECLRPADVKGLFMDEKDNGDVIRASDLTKLQLGANNMVLEYAYADIDKDITDDDWLHHVETAPSGTFTPDTDKIYVVVGECQQLFPSSYWTTWWFEDQHVTLYRWHEYQDDEPYFEKIKDVWIYR